MLQKEDLLHIRDSFRDLEKYRQQLNRVQCMSDFAPDTALELLQYAEELWQAECDENGDTDDNIITLRQKLALVLHARKRKRKRLLLFNGGDGLDLRLHIANHPHVIRERDIYCALCGQNNEKSCRGHRTNHKCGYCDVHLCVKVRTGFRKSCWETWQTAKKLKGRTPLPYRDTSKKYNSDEDEARDAASNVEQRPETQVQNRNYSSEEQETLESEENRDARTRKRSRSSADS